MPVTKHLTLGIDIDGVLADLSAALRPLIKEEFGVDLQKSEVVRWNYYIEIVGTMGHMLAMMDMAWDSDCIPLEEPDIAQTMKRLKNHCHRLIISSRTPASHPAVVAWLHEQGIGYDSLALLGAGEDKFEYPLDVLIDDRPSMVEVVRQYPTKFLLLRDQPWNRDVGVLPSNARRVNSLKDGVDFFLKGDWRG